MSDNHRYVDLDEVLEAVNRVAPSVYVETIADGVYQDIGAWRFKARVLAELDKLTWTKALP